MNDSSTESLSALAPLRVTIFRALWIASVVSSIGTWMQTVGAQWLLVEQPNATALVPLVQAASALPFLVLGLPSGVLGEFLNRRSLLIAVQAFQVVVGLLLTVLTWLGAMPPSLLLTLTFLLGAGSAVQLPAYQALVPELVPRAQIANAAALSSIGVNVARAIGPAVAGALIAFIGVPAVFLIDTATFVLFLVILLGWRGYHPPPQRAEPFVDATRAGIRYVWNAGVVRRIIICLALFVIPANAMWALLPLVAEGRLHLDAGGYGLLLTALGVGAIGGSLLLPRIRARWGLNTLTLVASAIYGIGMLVLAFDAPLLLIIPVLVVIGVAWIGVVASLNGAVQAFLPVWVRTRGVSVYQLVFFGSTAAGAILSGILAQVFGIPAVIVGASVIIVAAAASQLIWPLIRTEGMDRSTAPLPLSELPGVPVGDESDEAATLVLLTYVIPLEKQADFLDTMRMLERSRRRTGARHWVLYRSRDAENTYLEEFSTGSWREHLAQHEDRQTQYDLDLVRAASALSSEPVVVRHYTAAEGA
ncbi:MFS transporter [Leifsonia poae]|uniref:MFS transporter n=2 Tax=Actinomycetes TaxID=1760 RepID=A0A9W6HB50_9MICO|nr:MFS transporter [Leifsonia poae]GLJ76886.1 MFS transporter [Leifsonia poae]